MTCCAGMGAYPLPPLVPPPLPPPPLATSVLSRDRVPLESKLPGAEVALCVDSGAELPAGARLSV